MRNRPTGPGTLSLTLLISPTSVDIAWTWTRTISHCCVGLRTPNDAAKASARERIGQNVSIAAAHLADREHVVGKRFTVADAYLTSALLLLKRGGVDVAEWPSLIAYLHRMQQRPQVRDVIAVEQQMCRTLTF
jgi:glutathione S-transferase